MAGPFEPQYKRQIETEASGLASEGRIHWAGMLRDEVKWGAFFACEAFVLPSHQENFA